MANSFFFFSCFKFSPSKSNEICICIRPVGIYFTTSFREKLDWVGNKHLLTYNVFRIEEIIIHAYRNNNAVSLIFSFSRSFHCCVSTQYIRITIRASTCSVVLNKIYRFCAMTSSVQRIIKAFIVLNFNRLVGSKILQC